MGKDKKVVEIAEKGDKDKTHADFLAAVPDDEPRYLVIDFTYDTDDGRKQEKVVFCAWSPDSCGVKPKMLYSSALNTVKKKLGGAAKYLQITDKDDLSEEAM